MSSGFVSGGTIENPAERDEAWRRAQEELAEARKRKEDLSSQNEGKSLYEVLQANKAAKQEAFEEATRLKNQYRALDDDEAEFLDAVLAETRKKEAEVKKETLEQLDVFRQRQEEAERKALEEVNAEGPPVDADAALWAATGRKRKKSEKDGGLLKGVKLRRASSSVESAADAKKATASGDEVKTKAKAGPVSATESSQGTAKVPPAEEKGVSSTQPVPPPKTATSASPQPAPANTLALNLGYGSSDEDD